MKLEGVSKPIVAGVARLRGNPDDAISRSLATPATGDVGISSVLRLLLVFELYLAVEAVVGNVGVDPGDDLDELLAGEI